MPWVAEWGGELNFMGHTMSLPECTLLNSMGRFLKGIMLFAFCLALSQPVYAQARPRGVAGNAPDDSLMAAGMAANRRAPQLSPEIEALLALPKDKIDIGLAELTFAHDAFPNIVNVDADNKKIDELAAQVRQIPSSRHGPNALRAAIDEVLFRKEGYQYDFSPDAKTKISNFNLSGLLQTKQGFCGTLSMLYMAVAQRVGLPVYPVMAPAHVFLRVTANGAIHPMIETTSGDTWTTDAAYIKKFKISDAALKNGTYMRTLTYHQFLSVLLSVNATGFLKTMDRQHRVEAVAAALAYDKRAYEIDPRSDMATLGLMLDYTHMADLAIYNFETYAADADFGQIGWNVNQAATWRDKAIQMGAQWEDYANANRITDDADYTGN